jgi:hypothetical protein
VVKVIPEQSLWPPDHSHIKAPDCRYNRICYPYARPTPFRITCELVIIGSQRSSCRICCRGQALKEVSSLLRSSALNVRQGMSGRMRIVLGLCRISYGRGRLYMWQTRRHHVVRTSAIATRHTDCEVCLHTVLASV